MPTPARRPANSALDCSRIAAEFGLEVPPWTDGLPPVVAALCAARPGDAAPAQP
jgi:dTDP-4-dehydrorhamnose reductase